MSRFQVDSDQVAAATAKVQASAGRIQSEVDGMHSALLDLENSWTGSAAAAFQGVIGDWRVLERRVEEHLASIQRALDHAGRQYAEIEAANTRMFLA